MLAREHGIEGLFDSFAPLRLRPDCFVIVNDPVGITSRTSAITNNLTGILKFQRSRKTDREIIAQLVLRERRAITVGDLAARSGDIENVSACEFLCLECWNDLFIERKRRWFRRWRGARR